ncbi:hypothetical protein L6654_03155 [Bradyrhizobium sp. WYCCWR 13023]|uniref:Uncharacterized protein n=1 Tax=Bradyrhizobium zhengyangense TaxID=2911009 RepID=A0A9X1R5Z1_9BRAD|nr:hypothetical protein [Bradyrhizobium zhengyangense]MCG2625610.1 hypothetical protein [Bradyrhizobium zhengyangense]
MAKPDCTTSTSDLVWLGDALARAIEPLGSLAAAVEQLTRWLKDGKLAWTCMSWSGLDAEGLAMEKRKKLEAEDLVQHRSEQGDSTGRIIYSLPTAAYSPGDPGFWGAKLRIDWKGNEASEARRHGSRALGIKVSRAQLTALLPDEPHDGEKVRGAAVWITDEVKRMRAEGKIPPDIRITDLARVLERRMANAAKHDQSLRAIKWKSIRNQLVAWGLWPVALIK